MSKNTRRYLANKVEIKNCDEVSFRITYLMPSGRKNSIELETNIDNLMVIYSNIGDRLEGHANLLKEKANSARGEAGSLEEEADKIEKVAKRRLVAAIQTKKES